ncbi:10589_t:CDS:2, partial [Entrophospora sp. SA101]
MAAFWEFCPKTPFLALCSPTKPINSQPRDIPSINDFLESLDQKYGD